MLENAPGLDKNILQNLYDFCQKQWKNESIYEKDIAYKIYCYAVQLCSYNGFPKVVKDPNFESLDSQLLYRGTSDIEHHANLLCDYDYHYGMGHNVDGIFATFDMARALRYTTEGLRGPRPIKQVTPKRVLTFKLSSNADVIDSDDLDLTDDPLMRKVTRIKSPALKSIYEFVDSLEDEEKRENFMRFLSFYPSSLAVLLGYDAVTSVASQIDTVAVLNRGKMVVKESEFKNICSQSKKYKGGVIDFDQKYANGGEEFLNE